MDLAKESIGVLFAMGSKCKCRFSAPCYLTYILTFVERMWFNLFTKRILVVKSPVL